MTSIIKTRMLVVLSIGVLIPVACGTEDNSRQIDRPAPRLTVGVKADQPGIGMRNPDGSYRGFDVDVARYVARKLGVAPGDTAWKEVRSDNREEAIDTGAVDIVVASYSIDKQRRDRIGFAGPYLIAGQSLLVRADDTDISGPESLDGKKVCSAKGSTSADKIKSDFSPQVQLVQRGTYSDCVAGLRDHSVDAVTTDDVILAGYAAQNPGQFKLVGKPFTREYYGIGVKKSDKARQGRITSAISDMISDGSWQAAFDRNIGPSGYPAPPPPAVFGRSDTAASGTGKVDPDLAAAVQTGVDAIVAKNVDQLTGMACPAIRAKAATILSQTLPFDDPNVAHELGGVQPHVDVVGISQNGDRAESFTHVSFGNVPDKYKQYVKFEDGAVEWQKVNGQWLWCDAGGYFTEMQ